MWPMQARAGGIRWNKTKGLRALRMCKGLVGSRTIGTAPHRTGGTR